MNKKEVTENNILDYVWCAKTKTTSAATAIVVVE